MNSQTKQCQNCKKEFIIESSDFEFYDKIKVPSPTFCPECRMIRKMIWRNERALYKRKCDVPGHSENIISMYHTQSPYRVYDQQYFKSDEWNPIEFGKSYDFICPFFTQLQKLLIEFPVSNLNIKNDVDSC